MQEMSLQWDAVAEKQSMTFGPSVMEKRDCSARCSAYC